MSISAKNPLARKKTKISFRTDEDNLGKIKAWCKNRKITTSLFIEDTLAEIVLRENADSFFEDEKRKKKRKKCSIQTILLKETKDISDAVLISGTILDISENSLQVILQNFADGSFLEEKFYILLDLHKNLFPMLLPCTVLRQEHIHDQCILIVHFDLPASADRAMLQDFLKADI